MDFLGCLVLKVTRICVEHLMWEEGKKREEKMLVYSKPQFLLG